MTKGNEETFRGDSYVCYLDLGNFLTGVYTYIKICQIVYFKYVQYSVYGLSQSS